MAKAAKKTTQKTAKKTGKSIGKRVKEGFEESEASDPEFYAAKGNRFLRGLNLPDPRDYEIDLSWLEE